MNTPTEQIQVYPGFQSEPFYKNINTIERLEKWKNTHKSRYVRITIDDGYGATCWRVELMSGHGDKLKKIESHETVFLNMNDIPSWFVCVCDPNTDFEWPGLEQTINAALDRWEMLYGQ